MAITPKINSSDLKSFIDIKNYHVNFNSTPNMAFQPKEKEFSSYFAIGDPNLDSVTWVVEKLAPTVRLSFPDQTMMFPKALPSP
nr:hypothetical protein [Pedobacter panaciterrae]